MRIAIFSDVHGNLTAMEAVLAAIAAEEEPLDEIVFAGDLCLMGARPEACVELIRQHDPSIACIYGNTDEMVSGPPLLAQDIDAEERLRWQHVIDMTDWTREMLPPMDRAWLRALPFQRRISPTVNPHDDLLIVHANPHDVERAIFPERSLQEKHLGKVEQTDEQLERLLDGVLVGALAFGHLHIPSVREWGDMLLVNVASVSRPSDDDWRAKYAVLTWDGERWSAEHRQVEYDREAEIATFEERQPPGWEKEVDWLRAR